MGRRERYHLPGATYHVMLRGNASEQIFFHDKDRCRMCLLIQHGVERYGHRMLAYCFMNNHVHFAIQVGQISLSRIMQNLSFRYTQYINRKYQRVGHLFQGRFKSILVDSSKYLKELVRYIHLNPVRAGLVNGPEQYSWSSHNAYLETMPIAWISPNYLFTYFADSKQLAVQNFQNFVQAQTKLSEQINFKQGNEDGILGDDSFIEIVRREAEAKSTFIPTLSDLIDCTCNFYNITPSTLLLPGKNRRLSHIRALLALFVRETQELTLEELGDYLERDANALSRLAARLTYKSEHSELIQTEIADLKLIISQMSECPA